MQLQSRFPTESGDACRLFVEDVEDLWHLYNLIAEGDSCTARTTRKVKLQDKSGTGPAKVKVKKLVLEIQVTKVDFQPKDAAIRIAGRCITECEDIGLGQFHTLDIGQHDTVTVKKNDWDFLSKNRIREATDVKASSDLAAILFKKGEAALYLVWNSLLNECGRVQGKVSKNANAFQKIKEDRQLKSFYDGCIMAMQAQFAFSKLKCVIIGGPKIMTSDFMEYLFTTAAQKSYNEILGAKKMFVEVQLTGIGKVALGEALTDPTITKRIGGTKALQELQAIENFYRVQKENESKVAYGTADVEKAADVGAIEQLMISDTLFKAQDIAMRNRFSQLSRDVVHMGGNVIIVSSVGCAAEQITALADVAAVLRYPLID